MRARRSYLVITTAALLLGGCGFFTSPAERIARAEAQISTADYRAAMIELKNALQSEPENGRAWQLLAEVSLQLGDAQSADRELRRAMENGISSAAVSELAARIRLALAEYEQLLTAIEAGEILLEEPMRSVYRAGALQGMRRFTEAAAVFAEVLAADPDFSDARVGLAESYAEQGDLDRALQELEEVTTRDPSKAVAWLGHGSLLARRGQFEGALQSLEQARGQIAGLTVQQQAVLLGSLVETHLSLGKPAEAEVIHAELLRIAPESPLARFLRARIAVVRQDYSTAAAELQRLVTNVPGFVAARFLLGAVLLAQNNLQQANLHLSQVVQSSPENTEARKLLAQVSMRLNRPDAAMQVLTPALQAQTTDPQISMLFGAAQLQSGDERGAIALLERSVTVHTTNEALRLELATAYLRSGNSQRALAVLEETSGGGIRRTALHVAALVAARGPAAANAELNRLLAEHPEDVELLNLAAAMLVQQAEYERARALLVRALGHKADDVTTLVNLARLDVAAGNPAAAANSLERVLSVDPAHTTALLGLADLALRDGDTAGAIRWLEEWRARDPQGAEPRLRLLRMYLAQNRSEEAQAVFAEALAGASDAAAVHNAAGLAYLDASRYDEAVARFRSAVDADAGQAEYWLNLGRAQSALGQRQVARESVNRTLALQPNWIPAVGTAAFMDIRDGNNVAALSRVQRLKDQRPQDADVLILEGDVQVAIRQYEAADTAFTAAYRLRPAAVTALKLYRARALGRLGQVTEPLTTWLATRPDDYNVRGVLAEAHQLAGQRTRAIREYEIVIRDGPGNAVALNNLAWLYHETGDDRALATARQAHELAPASPVIADTYGWILLEQGRVQEALSLLEQAAKAAPDQPDVAYHFAAALARAGQPANAIQQLQTLLERHSQFTSREEAQRLLAELSAS